MTGRANREKKAEWKQALQRQAFDLKTLTGRKLSECYEEIARHKGYKSWNHVCADMKARHQ